MWSASNSFEVPRKPYISRRDTCRLCSALHLDLVMQLTPTALANAFVSADELDEEQPTFPLDLFLCRSCGHLQLLDVVDPESLFRDYVYVSSTSPVFVEHFRNYADEVRARLNLQKDSLVVEIGSNDGTLLRFFQERGMRVLGVDPARDIAEKATGEGVKTIPAFFSSQLAGEVKQEYGSAKLIVANNVFAHIDNLVETTQGIRELLSGDGVFVFEVSYLVDVVGKVLFDTIYHEHLCYHSVKPLKGYFERQEMELIDTERVPSHGGSLRGTAQLAGGARKVSASVARMISLEEELALQQPETIRSFARRIEQVKTRLNTLLLDLKSQNKSIAAYGAPAKATTLLYQFDLGDLLDFIVDDSPLKQNLFSPGHHLPVLPAQAIYDRRPDYLLILAWNFSEPIMEKQHAFLEQGGHFIIPLPEVRMV